MPGPDRTQWGYYLDQAFVAADTLDTLGQPGLVGTSRTAGIDLNKPRLRAVFHAVIALAALPRGFTAAQLADKVCALMGSFSRRFMAQVVKSLGKGGQRRAESELGWHRRTIRKGTHELDSGFVCYDNYSARGRKPAEYHLLQLLDDIKAIAEAESQTDPTFQTTRLYIRLSAAEVGKQLIEQKGYGDEQLPSAETIRTKLNGLGYHLNKVKKVNR